MSVLLDKKELVESFLNQRPQCLSSFSFTSIFAWQDFCEYEFKMIRGCLCIFARDTVGTFLYLPPLGDNVSEDTIAECFGIMRSQNSGSKVSRIENVSYEMLPQYPADKYDRYKKGYEYCYWRRDIAELKGNAYKSQRWAYNNFIELNDCQYQPFSLEMLDDCMSLYWLWLKHRSEGEQDPVVLQMLKENEAVHRLIMTHYQELGLTGRVVRVDNILKAYTFGYALSDKMFCVLLEITDLSIKGLSAYIFREFSRDIALRKYDFINVMDDMELPRLGQSKMMYHPRAMLPAYVITQK